MASWRKYPCESRPDVLSVDIVSRDLDRDTGILRATRVVWMQEKLPRVVASFIGGGVGVLVEHSYVDPRNQVMVLKSHNLSFQSVIVIEEVCTYTVCVQETNPTTSAHAHTHTERARVRESE
jgi:hypothetical protein